MEDGTHQIVTPKIHHERGNKKTITSHLTEREGRQVQQHGERDQETKLTKKGPTKIAMWLDFKYIKNDLLWTIRENEFFLPKNLEIFKLFLESYFFGSC
jgi:hypothetical protein